MGNGQRLAADELQVKINRKSGTCFFPKKKKKKDQMEPRAQEGAGSEQLGFQITRL